MLVKAIASKSDQNKTCYCYDPDIDSLVHKMNQQCKVCGEAAAGFHFGAFTCEGCKSFFGRTYNNLSSISECKNGGQCIINKKNRTSCKACRLRKCLVVGMSKSGSRYGRRSNWFKIHCLLQEQSNNNNSTASLYQNALQNLLPTLECKKLDELRSTPESDDMNSNSPSPFSERSISPGHSSSLLLQQRLYYASAFAAIRPTEQFLSLTTNHDQNEPIDLSIKKSTDTTTINKNVKTPLDLTKNQLSSADVI